MVIKLYYEWIREYLKTDLSAADFADRLSLVGPSVERVERKKDDFVFEIEITPNRVDAACVVGIAQEGYAALYDKNAEFVDKFAGFDYQRFREEFIKEEEEAKVEVFEKGASRYIAVIVKGVQVGRSPEFVQKRLEGSGIKVINNIVDISNYVMLELGQPNHIFDLNRLAGGRLIMKEVDKKTSMILLDDRRVELAEGDLVFIDGDGRLVDLCGIMGGALSSVQRDTKDILITIPVYNKNKIRRTSMRLGIRTEAAVYFEKGLDENRCETALKLLLDLILKYAGGRVASKIFDFYPDPYQERLIEFSPADVERLIGVEIGARRMRSILSRLGFSIKKADRGKIIVGVPSHRRYDIFTLQDIVEEVARVYGYHHLPSRLSPFVLLEQDQKVEKVFSYQDRIKYMLKDRGFTEVMNYSMISEEMIKEQAGDEKDFLKIRVPINKRLEYMRQDIFSSLLQNIKENKGFVEKIKIFELAKIYKKNPLSERLHLALALSQDFYHLQALLRLIFSEMGIREYKFADSHFDFLSDRQAEVLVKGESAGFIGQLEKRIGHYEVISVAELDFEKLVSFANDQKTIKPVPVFAVIRLDFNFKLSDKLRFEDIKEKAEAVCQYLYDFKVVDVYEDKITIRFRFTSFEKNLTEAEAKMDLSRLIKALGLRLEKELV